MKETILAIKLKEYREKRNWIEVNKVNTNPSLLKFVQDIDSNPLFSKGYPLKSLV